MRTVGRCNSGGLSRRLLVVVLWIGVTGAWAAHTPPPQDAEAAFEGGDYGRALELYERRLAENPHDARALFVSAMLLSWDDRLDESIARYDRLLRLEPDHRRARFERAKVLSWAGRNAAAVEAFRAILEAHPDDDEARLAYARCLSWMGDYRASRSEYGRILERTPDRVDALVGTAQTYAWAGQLRTARTWYASALAVDEGSKDAAIGLASVELWSGNPGSAGELSAALSERFPDDRAVRELRGRTRKALAPWVRGVTERTEDTDDNRLDVHGASVGWGIRAGPSLSVGLTRFTMQDPTRSARIDSLHATVGLVPGSGQRLILRPMVDRRRDSTGQSGSELLGSAHYTWGLDRRIQIGAVVGRDALRYSPAITDNNIRFTEYSPYLATRVGSRLRINVNAGHADVSDGNARQHFNGGMSYAIRQAAPSVSTGYRFRYMDFDEDRDGGYFDPGNFRAHLAQLVVRGSYGERRNSYSFSVDTGLQSFVLNGNDVEGDRIVVLYGTLGFPLGQAFLLELTAGWGDYAAQTAGGFESRQLRLQLRWQGGADA